MNIMSIRFKHVEVNIASPTITGRDSYTDSLVISLKHVDVVQSQNFQNQLIAVIAPDQSVPIV